MSDLLLIEGTSDSLRKLFSIREDARLCFVDAEPGDWGEDAHRYLVSHECAGSIDHDVVIELWARPDTDPSCPWYVIWELNSTLNSALYIAFCPYCGVNLNDLFADPFWERANAFDDSIGR